ncbi:WecB/TagA/CpsF family glycosyltransferase [Kocuria palustris]|uniref:WecB/TagA/CpsF family glycosyltransferase n=1 Tax=Kocuria palustris TaxID=71999 RepID=UPI00077B70BB|nr:WecB/TagA/CpsF family glycosyltransferase [Kocuria palustris]
MSVYASAQSSAQLGAPKDVDWLIIHQFDAARTSPGGIDTIIRGIVRYTPPETSIAVVGVDTTPGGDPSRIGRWEQHRFGERSIHFLPVVSLDPADQSRRVPHTLRLVAGLLRHLHRLPRAARVQCHRMDTAAASLVLLRRPLVYLIHTQVGGSTGRSSDSFWRFAGKVHPALERAVSRRAVDVRVFSPERIDAVREWNPAAQASPTWWDPDLVSAAARDASAHDPYRIVWIGRIEKLKDPGLAVRAFAELVDAEPRRPWTLHFYGPGTQLEALRTAVQALPSDAARRIHIHGRVEPTEVARAQASSGVFLMTSFPGYEGFPTVIVESLAAGMPVVVTEGADPGHVIIDGLNGFVTGRDPKEMAQRIREASKLERTSIPETVATMSAPAVVRSLMSVREPSETFLPTLAHDHGTTVIDGMPMETGTVQELENALQTIIDADRPELVVTANVDQVLNLASSPGLRRSYEAAGLRLIDGMPLVLLARALGARQVHRHTGADLLPLMARQSATRGWRIVIAGGASDVASSAVRRLREQNPSAWIERVPFPHLSDVSDEASKSVVEDLQRRSPDVVFLCLGSPKQEEWFLHWRHELPSAVYIGAGAAVDFAAGAKSRAPRAIQNAGLEWVWRLSQEPSRLASRYLIKGPRFLGVIARSLVGGQDAAARRAPAPLRAEAAAHAAVVAERDSTLVDS